MDGTRIDLRDQLTAVVITRNRVDELRVTLENFARLPEQVCVIVVDNASTDGTQALVRNEFPQARYLRMSRNLYGEARNVGAGAARTPYIAFTDDDCRWQPGSLQTAVEVLDTYPKVGALAAQVLVRGEKPDPLNRYFETSPLPQFVPMPGPSLMGFLEGSVVMRRSAFLQSRGYEARARINGEGRRVAIRLVLAGWGITYEPRLVCHHFPSEVRNVRERQLSGLRNDILTAAAAEPWEDVLFEINLNLRKGLKEPYLLAGVAEALLQLPLAARDRQPLPPRMREYFRLLRQQKKIMESKAS